MTLLKNSIISIISLLFISCGSNTDADIVDIQKIVIDQQEVSIYSTDRETTNLLTATAIFNDNSTKDITDFVTWNSSDTTIATVIKGTIYPGTSNGGDSNITISYQSLSTPSILLHSKKLLDFNISILDNDINSTGIYPLQALGNFEDNITKEIETNIFWSSSNDAEITIDDNITSIEIIEDTNITATLFSDENFTQEILYKVE